jgi:rhodanese-related sulfurtransferase
MTKPAEAAMSKRITINQLLASARAGLDRLSPIEAYEAHRSGATLIDIRCAEQRQADGGIPGAVPIPLSVLYWRLDPASRSRDPSLADLTGRIVLLCAHGYSSSLAAATLRTLGFAQATDVDGGWAAWAAAGLPVTSPDASPPSGSQRPGPSPR